MPPPVARVRPNWTPADWRGDGRPHPDLARREVGGRRWRGQVFAIARAIRPRYRLLVLLATFAAEGDCGDGRRYPGRRRSEVGGQERPISLPPALHADIEVHLARFAEHGPYGRRFVGPLGGVPRRRNFNRVWKRAPTDAGIPADLGLHPHHLRYTGSTWSAQSGATPKLGSATPARGRRWYTSTRHATAIRLSRLHSTP